MNNLLKETEDKIEKNCHSIASHANILSEHTENINTCISTNASFNNRFELIDKEIKDLVSDKKAPVAEDVPF